MLVSAVEWEWASESVQASALRWESRLARALGPVRVCWPEWEMALGAPSPPVQASGSPLLEEFELAQVGLWLLLGWAQQHRQMMGPR